MQELKKEWEESFEHNFEMKNFALYSKKHDMPATTNEIKEFINLLLAKQQEEFVKCIPEERDIYRLVLFLFCSYILDSNNSSFDSILYDTDIVCFKNCRCYN